MYTTGLVSRVRICPEKNPRDPKGDPQGGLKLGQLKNCNQLPRGPLGVPGGFSEHNHTLLPEPILYVTLILLVQVSKLVYFWHKGKNKLSALRLFLIFYPKGYFLLLEPPGDPKGTPGGPQDELITNEMSLTQL